MEQTNSKKSSQINRFTLNFDYHEVEKGFRHSYFNKSLKMFRISFITVSLLYLLFGFLDKIVAQEYLNEFLIIRFALVLPLLTIVFILSYFKFFEKIWQQLLMLCFIATGSGIIYMLVKIPDNMFYYSGLFLVLLAGFFFIRLRYFAAAISSIILIVIYISFFNFLGSEVTINSNYLSLSLPFYISTIIISIVASYNTELLERNEYIKKEELKLKQSEIENINTNLEQIIESRSKELIKAKEKAEESEEKYKSLYTFAGVGIGFYSTDGYIIEYNEVALKHIGKTKEDIENRHIRDVYGKHDGEVYEKRIAETVKSKQSIDYVDQIELTGREIWFKSNYSLVYDKMGAIAGVQIMSFDISDLKRTELQLTDKNEEYQTLNEELRQTNDELIKAKEKAEESEEKYKALYNNAPLAFQSLNSDGCILDINPMWLTTLGYEKNEVLGKWFGDFLHPDFVPHFRKNFPVFTSKGYIHNVEFLMLKKDKTEIFVSFEGCIGYDEQGKVKQTYCTFKDITEQKKSEQKLKESESKFKGIFQNSNVGIALIMPNGKISNVNKEFEKILGYTETELLKMNARDFTHLDDMNKEDVLVDKLIKGEIDNYRIEKRYIHKNGNIIWVDLSISCLKDEKGDFSLFMGIIKDITEQKQAEKDLKYSEERFKSFMNYFPGATFIKDKNNQLLYCNESFAKMLNSTVEEITGTYIDENITPELEKVYEQENKQVIENCTSIQSESVFDNNGEKSNWLTYKFPIELDAEVLLGAISIDITDRKKAEEALKESEERFKVLHNASFGGILIHDKGLIIECNQGISEISGFTYEDLIGADGVKLLIANESHELAIHNISSGFEKPYEVIAVKKNGEKYPARLEARQIPYKGKMVRVVEFRDITELKQAEYKNNALLEIIKRSNDFVGLASFDSKAFFVNTAGQKMVGLDSDEAASQTKIEDYFLEEDLPFLRDEIFPTLMRDGRWIGEFRFKHFKTGQPIEVYYDVFRSKDPNTGEVINIGTITKDIRQQKAYEKELLEAKEKAEESERLKTAFLANMSHEIRTPMNGILGFADLLKSPDLNSEEHLQYISIIEKSGNRMLNILNDIIDISKIESGHMEVNTDEVDIEDQLNYLHTFFKPEANRKGLDLKLKNNLPSEASKLFTDGEKISAVLINLIKNAIKYTDKGEIEFGCNLVKLEDSGAEQKLLFFVKDTGIGIAEERLEAIFDRFVQADIEDIHAREGAGLGLSISKAYIEMLGGNIWVESELGKGTCFTFTLPYNYKQQGSQQEKVATPETKIQDRLANQNILIVDDDENTREYFQLILRNNYKNLYMAKNGLEALEIYEKNRNNIDIILLDIKMPEPDGYQVAKKLLQINPDVKMIAQTAYAISGDKEKCLQEGFVDYIAKPIKKEELFQKLTLWA